jgi:16S rRNA (guanine527-N7)-methyltransferase
MQNEFKALLEARLEGYSEEVRQKICSFYEVVLKENQLQNLTRLISPSDFFYGHVVDVLEFIKVGRVGCPSMDLGSGVGIPGLLAALLTGEEWILSESEKRKAEYLQKAATTLGLSSQSLRVSSLRAEEYLKSNQVESIVARAVGPVERIYGWIRQCSTWNTLILFKGPSWEEEWERFQKTKHKSELKIAFEHAYSVQTDSEIKSRKIVYLSRVPRGTHHSRKSNVPRGT